MTDNETDRILHLLVGLVVISGAICLAWAGMNLAPVPLIYPAVLALLIAVAGSCMVRSRIRSQHLITTTSAALLITVLLVPASWAVVCAAVGTVVSMGVRRLPLRKAAFNTAKDVVGVAAAAAMFKVAGVTPVVVGQPGAAQWWRYLFGLCLAALTYALVDTALATPVISLASGSPWRQMLAHNVSVEVPVRLANVVVAAVTVALHEVDPRLLTVTPLAVVVVYLTNRHRLYLREERRAWQQLAASTDALSTAGIDEVLHTAIQGAAGLYPDLEIEVELNEGEERRIVRGDQTGISYDGPAQKAPSRDGPTLDTPLETDPGADGDLGVLRLRFRNEIRLSERERYMLTTFVAGLSTAVRNAQAYARVSQMAKAHAHDATHDALTGLPNRRQLHERAAARLAQPNGGTTALMLLDLDHFKEVNDTLGHAAGDKVLVEVARRLRDAAEPDALVARLGGDEFAVLFTDLPAPALASHRAQRVLESLREPMDLDGVLVSLRTSAGLAIAGDHTDPGELLRRADVAMYQSKDSERQVAVYAQARDSADIARLALAGELPRAVEGREFTVGFQPIVDLASGQVVAAEALARWEHPDLGHLQPATFLGLIERSGLLTAFTETVLDRALAAAATWHAAGFDLQVAVNVSPRSLADPSLPETVFQALDQHGVPAHRLTLELTETSAIGHLDVVARVVADLRAVGVRIALDDFGTRHSSLAAVSQVPVDQLKIDRHFVAALESSASARAVVCSIIELGRRLDLIVVAEGVEQIQQRQTLWELGCTAAQGKLFGWPPKPSEELLEALRRGYDGVPGTLAERLHPDATVVRLPRQSRASGNS